MKTLQTHPPALAEPKLKAAASQVNSDSGALWAAGH